MEAALSKRSAAVAEDVDVDVAADGLFGVLYSELHRMARRELNRSAGFPAARGATTLLHEAYLKISGNEGPVFADRARFMAYAARVMRGLIIDDIRRRRSHKRGGQVHITSLGTHHADGVADPATLLKIGDLLDELARVALEVGEAAATLAGEHDADVDARARELATAIVRRRNDALIPLRVADRVACRS